MKRALITGGSGALGAAIARALATQGMEVLVHANSHVAAAETIVAAIKASGGAASAVAFDVTNAQQYKQTLERILAAGSIQVIVNNAGIHDDAVMPGMSAEQWSRVIDVSLNGFSTSPSRC